MGYTGYDNHENLADSLLQEKPWQSLDQTLLDYRYRQQMHRLEDPTLLYVKPPLNTDSVIAVREEFKRSLFSDSLIVDDPTEYSSQILEWYADKILIADAVVVHLLSAEHVAYRAGYDGMGRVSVTHVVERGYSAMLKQPETAAA